jgi:hypothetical protein
MEEQQIKLSSTEKLIRNKKSAKGFIKGPIELPWITETCKLSKSAIKVALALSFLRGIQGNTWFKFESHIAKRFGIDRQCKSRGLIELEKSGLIEIDQKAGSLPLIKITAGP